MGLIKRLGFSDNLIYMVVHEKEYADMIMVLMDWLLRATCKDKTFWNE